MCMCDLHMARWRTLKPAISFWSLQLGRSVCVSRSVMSDSSRPRGMYPTRLLCPWIFQARILERVAISFSRGSSWPREWTQVSCTADRLYHESPATERESNKAQGGDETRCLSGTKMKVQHSHCLQSSLISSPLPFCSVLPKVHYPWIFGINPKIHT